MGGDWPSASRQCGDQCGRLEGLRPQHKAVACDGVALVVGASCTKRAVAGFSSRIAAAQEQGHLPVASDARVLSSSHQVVQQTTFGVASAVY